MNIIFYESSIHSSASRLEFQKKIVLNNINLITSIDELNNIAIPIHVVFYHTSDKEIYHINQENKKREWHTNIDDALKVAWGGRATFKNQLEIESKEIGYINFKELRDKIPFLNKFFSSPKTVEEIYNYLLNIDEDLENLLKPFATLSPFAAKEDYILNKEGNPTDLTVSEAHKNLIEYIENKK